MAFRDPYTGEIIGGGLMNPYTTYGSPYEASLQDTPTQTDAVARSLPSQYGSGEQTGGGLMSAAQSGAQMSPEAQQRAMDALSARGQSMALGAGKKALGSLAQGADVGQAISSGMQSVVSPTGLMSLATEPAYAAYGVAPETTFGKMVSYGTKAVSGLLGPLGGVIGAVGSSPFASALEDAMDMRSAEADKDAMEDVHGFFGGRSKVSDALTGQKDVAGTYADAKSFAEAADKAVDKLGTDYGATRSTGTGLTEAGRRAYQKQAIKDYQAYQRAQEEAKKARARQAWGRSSFGGGDSSSGMAGRGGTADSDVGGAAGGYGGGGGSGMGSPGSGMGRGR